MRRGGKEPVKFVALSLLKFLSWAALVVTVGNTGLRKSSASSPRLLHR